MLQKQLLKQLLVNTYDFIDNNYLDEYIKLVTEKQTFSNYTEKHHIIPVNWYKLKFNCQSRREAERYAKDDKNNILVELLFKDHCKAHYLLYFCTMNEIKYGNAIAYLQMINVEATRDTKKDLPILTAAEYNKLQKDFEQIKNDPDSKFLSDTELQFIKENVQKLGTTKCAEILQRPAGVIIHTAVSNNWMLSGKCQVYWTDTQKQWLKENITKYSRQECAKFLGKTEASVHAMEQRLHISGSRISTVKWSSEDDIWLVTNYKLKTIDELIEYLHRSSYAIRARLRTLGITSVNLKMPKKELTKKSTHKVWTVQDKTWLQDNISRYTVAECAKKLERSTSAVEHMLLRLNIKLDHKHKKWNK